MNVARLRGSTAVDKALSITSITSSKLRLREGDGAQAGSPPHQDLPTKIEPAASSVSTYLQGISATSCNEIDALISDLSGLREKLAVDGSRIEQDVVDFAALNQSVVRLTEVVMDSVTHVKALGASE